MSSSRATSSCQNDTASTAAMTIVNTKRTGWGIVLWPTDKFQRRYFLLHAVPHRIYNGARRARVAGNAPVNPNPRTLHAEQNLSTNRGSIRKMFTGLKMGLARGQKIGWELRLRAR